MNLHMKHLMRKGTILLCAGALLVSPACVQAKSGYKSESTTVPADAVSGGVIKSNVYGEVLVTREADGTYNYTGSKKTFATHLSVLCSILLSIPVL